MLTAKSRPASWPYQENITQPPAFHVPQAPKGDIDVTGYPKEGGDDGDLGGVISIGLSLRHHDDIDAATFHCIETRVLLVSAVLIAILAGMTFYTTAKLAANSRAVAETAELAALSQLANQTRTAFGEYRYWLTDLAVSLLRLSELNAKAAKRNAFWPS